MKKRNLLIISLIASMLFGACSARQESRVMDSMPAFGGGNLVYDEKALPAEEPAAMAPQAAPEERGSVAGIERMVIQNGELKVSVADPVASMNATANLAKSLGGYVVSSNTKTGSSYDGLSYTRAFITVRVPAEKLTEAMDMVKAMAVDSKTGVIQENLSGQDVTSEYVDSESRLRNLEAAEKQLQVLLEATSNVEDTMEVFRELTRIREEIEVTKGHMQYLKESAALSALTVEFIAEASLKPIEIGGWKPEGVVKDALQDLVYALQDLGTFLIRFGITCLPFLIPLGVVVWLIVRAIRKKRKARKLNPPFKPVATPTAEGQESVNEKQNQA